jgi:DNA-binding CsgD family transcriptional regulator
VRVESRKFAGKARLVQIVSRVRKQGHGMARSTRVTKQLRIMTLVRQGMADWEVAERIGCRENDVRIAKRRADIAATMHKPVTSRFKIAELARAGHSDAHIAEHLGCSPAYVRVARQRTGLSQPRDAVSNASGH